MIIRGCVSTHVSIRRGVAPVSGDSSARPSSLLWDRRNPPCGDCWSRPSNMNRVSLLLFACAVPAAASAQDPPQIMSEVQKRATAQSQRSRQVDSAGPSASTRAAPGAPETGSAPRRMDTCSRNASPDNPGRAPPARSREEWRRARVKDDADQRDADRLHRDGGENLPSERADRLKNPELAAPIGNGNGQRGQNTENHHNRNADLHPAHSEPLPGQTLHVVADLRPATSGRVRGEPPKMAVADYGRDPLPAAGRP